ncbi:MAG TPA: Maf family protein [Gemmatimonadaceae bacterium]|nr:Maf family protein [Gemmatimonadaceae bacterium]
MSAPQLYLASKSPRREQLLRQLDVEFETLHLREAVGRERDVVEKALDAEPASHYVERIARTKAQVGWDRMQNRKLAERPVLGADTEVVLDGDVFGKPRDAGDATAMIRRLSGRTHQVVTAVAVRYRERTEVEVSLSKVTLRRLGAAEIERYVATGEPLDKAGAYAVQGRAAAFISRLEGSYTGVVGLPLYETAALLARVGVRVL